MSTPTKDWTWQQPMDNLPIQLVMNNTGIKGYTSPWPDVVVMFTGFALQFVLPGCVYVLLRYISKRRDESNAQLEETQRANLNRQIDPERDRIEYESNNGIITPEETQVKISQLKEKMKEGEQRFKAEQQKIEAKRKVKNIGVFRIYSLAFNVGLWVWLSLLISISVVNIESDVLDALHNWSFFCFVTGYLLVFAESFSSREAQYMSEINKVEYAAVYLKELRETAPHLVMHAECYHIETKTRTVYDTDSNGKRTTSRTETYKERVVTHRDSEIFSYGFWIDISDECFAFSHDYGVTKIKLESAIIPGDLETRMKLSEAEDAFQRKNKDNDVHMNYKIDIGVDGFRNRIAAYVDPDHRSWWISIQWFRIATALLMSWPYRWLFRARTGKTKYKLEKQIFMTRPQPTEDVDRDYTAYDVTQELQDKICQDDKWTSEAEDSGTDKKDKQKLKKGKGKKVKTDVDLELGAVTLKRY